MTPLNEGVLWTVAAFLVLGLLLALGLVWRWSDWQAALLIVVAGGCCTRAQWCFLAKEQRRR